METTVATPTIAPTPAPSGPKDVGSITELMGMDNKDFAEAIGYTEKPVAAEPKPEATDSEPEEGTETAEATTESIPPASAVGGEGGEAPTEAVAETKELPSADTKNLLTKFQIFDTEGEVDIPNVTLKYKANGKEVERPLDKVVLLAQMGEYNQERENQINAAKQYVPQVIKENDTLRAQVADYDSWMSQLLSNEDLYLNAKEEWLAQNAPEQRATRAEQELQNIRTQTQNSATENQAINYIQTQISPVLEQLVTANPLVSEHEVFGYYSMATAPLLVNGRVSPDRLHHVKTIVERDVANWVRSQQIAREDGQKRSAGSIVAAQTAATIAKRQVAKVIQPQGSSAPPKVAKKSYATVEDWLNSELPLPNSE